MKLKKLNLLLIGILLCIPYIGRSQTDMVTVSGVVVDSLNSPLIGVTIVQKDDFTKGTITLSNGEFSLQAKQGSTLVVSYLGYETEEIVANSASPIRIELSSSALELDDVVVISYGVAKKEEIVGSISTVNMSDASSTPYNRVEQMLQGKVTGVTVVQNTGEPGSGVSVNIRGIGTTGDSAPLYVIDGIPTKSGLNNFNPQDIESISILKDASAAAMYGSRAANGVVLIKTKSGKAGTFTLNYDQYHSVQSNIKQFDMLNAQEWATVRNQATLNDNPDATLPWSDVESLGEGTNWQEVIMQNALIQNYNLSLAGGNEQVRYALSLNHYEQDGIIKYSDYERSSIRVNIDASPKKWLDFGNNASFSMIGKNGVDVYTDGVLKNSILAVPTMSVYNEDGSFAGPNTLLEGNTRNPLSQAASSNIDDETYRFTNSTYIGLNLMDGMTFRSSLGIDYLSSRYSEFTPTYKEGDLENNEASLYNLMYSTLDVIWENTFNYTFNINKSKFGVLLGYSMEQNIMKNMYATKSGYVSNEEYLHFLDNGTVVSSASQVGGTQEEWSMMSGFGRIDYGYDNRYLASVTMRADGSSRFAQGNRLGIFPSVAVGWRISEEDFMDSSAINNLKLKASWGQLGNQDIGLYSYCGTMSPYYYNMDGEAIVGYAPSALYNEDISWETTTQVDLGVEFATLRNKLTIEAGYYYKLTDDMLVQLPVSSTTGFSSGPYQNAGSVRNQGFEFAVNYRNSVGDFNYDINANFTTVDNKVMSLGGLEDPITQGVFFDLNTRTEKGQPIGQLYGYVMEGIYQTQEEINEHLYATENPSFVPGDVKYKDLNNDGVFDSNDRTVIGNPIPKFIFGLNLSADYKGIDFMAQFQGVAGNDIYNATKWWSENTSETRNYSPAVLDSWTGPGTSNTMPRLTMGASQNNIASTRYVEEGDYIRLKNLQVGYTFPSNWMKKVCVRSLRLYVSAQNLFTITKYTGFNPEVSGGFDEITYPQARTFTVGVNLGIF
ncbi:MAG: TonB-dependent receptor [Rikenellaceae bacterium]